MVVAAVGAGWRALQHASDGLRADMEVVSAAAAGSMEALRWVPAELTAELGGADFVKVEERVGALAADRERRRTRQIGLVE